MAPRGVACVVGMLLLAGCGALHSGPCSGLSSDERGPTKQDYLPCAGSILESMSRLDQGLRTLAAGNEAGREQAVQSMGELRSSIKELGGLSRLKASWADPQLNEINRGIRGAYEVYSIEATALGHPVKQLRGEVSMNNVELARRAADEARSVYQRLK